MRISSTLVSLSILASAATACGSSSDSAVVRSDSAVTTVASTPADTDVLTTEPGEPVPAEIAGTRWRLDSRVTIGGLQPVPSGFGAGIIISPAGTMDVNTGCNTGTADVDFHGEYAMTVGRLSLTDRACADDTDGIEAGMLAIFAEPLTWSVEGDALVLVPTTISDTGLHFTATA